MPIITTQAGPWNMTVFSYEEDDPENPLAHLSLADIARLPFGAAELSRDGTVLSHIDTEPGEGGSTPDAKAGMDFFAALAPWARHTAVEAEFRQGVAAGSMNVVFDCAAPRLPYKVRIRLKISPILGTFWVFIKKLSHH